MNRVHCQYPCALLGTLDLSVTGEVTTGANPDIDDWVAPASVVAVDLDVRAWDETLAWVDDVTKGVDVLAWVLASVVGVALAEGGFSWDSGHGGDGGEEDDGLDHAVHWRTRRARWEVSECLVELVECGSGSLLGLEESCGGLVDEDGRGRVEANATCYIPFSSSVSGCWAAIVEEC